MPSSSIVAIFPERSIVPESGFIIFAIKDKNVLLPAPLRPRIPRTSPLRIFKVRLWGKRNNKNAENKGKGCGNNADRGRSDVCPL